MYIYIYVYTYIYLYIFMSALALVSTRTCSISLLSSLIYSARIKDETDLIKAFILEYFKQ